MLNKGLVLAVAVGLILNLFLVGTAGAQTSPDVITAVSPSSASQGDTGLEVTISLEGQSPPTPPLNAALQVVTIGPLEATSHSRNSLTEVTAVFDFPADAPLGPQDLSLTFEGPDGSPRTFAEAAAFEILPPGPAPELAITKTVETQHTPAQPGESLTYTVIVANGGHAAVDATVTDTLPDGVLGTDLDWTGTIAAGSQVSFAIPATVTADPAYAGLTIVNTATYNHAGGSGSASASFAISGSTTIEATYAVVDTGQAKCYDDGNEITYPAADEAFYGQDAQHDGNQPSYTLSDDGLSVDDNVTGLTWTQSPDLDGDGDIAVEDKLAFSEALAYADVLNAQNYGGYSDWRLPSIKELYSLMDFRGTDPSGPNPTDLRPFIDTDYFDFGYGDTSAGERLIDAQFWSSNAYVGTVFGNQSAAFGLNLADGRIKGYPADSNGPITKLNYVYFVRGNTDYGRNDFVDNGHGTITDNATGLMWSQDDSGDGRNTGPRSGMTWEEALAWVEQKNAENYFGYDDWRLPNAKEMQSIVDYDRAPDATSSAAIDPVFHITQITNEAGQVDYPWFWTSTTHVRSDGSGPGAVYISFGRATGYMNDSWTDVHGAGAQRSDRKGGGFDGLTYEPDGYYFSQSPQGDATRIYNYVRLVRDAEIPEVTPPEYKVYLPLFAGNDSVGSDEGYNLFAPLGETTTYLSDEVGDAVHLLENGNALICDGPAGYSFEVTAFAELAWEYDHGQPAIFCVTHYP